MNFSLAADRDFSRAVIFESEADKSSSNHEIPDLKKKKKGLKGWSYMNTLEAYNIVNICRAKTEFHAHEQFYKI